MAVITQTYVPVRHMSVWRTGPGCGSKESSSHYDGEEALNCTIQNIKEHRVVGAEHYTVRKVSK